MSDLLKEAFLYLEEQLGQAENERDWIKEVRDNPSKVHSGYYHREMTRLADVERRVARVRFIIETLRLFQELSARSNLEANNAVFVSADGLRALCWVNPDSVAGEVVRPIRRERRMTCAEFYGDKLPELEPFRCRKYRFDGQYEKSPFGKLAIFKEVQSHEC